MPDDNPLKVIDADGPDQTRCRHFNGTINTRCAAGVGYDEVRVEHAPIRYVYRRRGGRLDPHEYRMAASLPCSARFNLSGAATCPLYAPLTAEERAARAERLRRASERIERGLSPCCEAPLDESRVIQAGLHKGHGPRHCSKCGRLAFLV